MILIKRITTLVLGMGLLFSGNLFAKNTIDLSALWKQLPKGSEAAFVLLDPITQQVLAHRGEQRLLVPASLEKIATSLAALAWLGPDFYYRTQLIVNRLPKKGQVQGDLWVNFNGDPTLSTHALDQLFAQLVKQNIHQIQGTIWLNDGVFNRYPLGAGWAWDDVTACYSAPVRGISLDGNCFSATLHPQDQGHRARLVADTPESSIKLSSDISVQTDTDHPPLDCVLNVKTQADNRYHFYGCIMPSLLSRQLNFAIINPEIYTIAQIKASLARYHIRHRGRIAITRSSQMKQIYILAEHRSAPLSDLVHTMLKESDNHIADSLLKTLGHRYYQTPGNFANGSHAVHAILKQVSGIDLTHSLMVDGSGLSRYNLINPKDLVQLLNWASQSFRYGQIFTSALPIAGVDGTLQHRFGSDTTLDGLVYAKTGTLGGVRNLAGFIRTKGHKTLIFVLMLRGYLSHVPAAVDAVRGFESHLLKAVYTTW